MRHLVFTNTLPKQGVFGRDISPLHYRRYLGQTLPALAWDASKGLFPNAFAALAGTVQAGGNLLLSLPSNYPEGDPDHLRLIDFGTDVSDCCHFFNVRLRHFTAQTQTIVQGQEGNTDNVIHRLTPQIYLGKRGRGKTTRLGEKILWLQRYAAGEILIVTPFRSNLQRLQTMLPSHEKCRFLPPDDALYRQPSAQFLIVDEASAIPHEQLLALLARYPAFTLAATEDGYEGTGREFSLRTLPQIMESYPATEVLFQHGGKRFLTGDPLEWILENAFLLQIEHEESHFPNEIAMVSREQLASDERLLRSVYALLHHAHYRTSPEDLKRLLDLPQQTLFIARNKQSIAGVMQIFQEMPLPTPLAQAVIHGERRPQGRLLLQQLLHKTKNLTFNRPLNRISRLAVAQMQRRQGIAASLIAAAKKELADPLGVSYGHTEALANFWQKQGFQEIYRAPTGKIFPTSLRLLL